MTVAQEPGLVADGERIVAPAGSPLHAALIGTAQFDVSLRFYRDRIGLREIARCDCSGLAFERHWRLAPGTAARIAVLADRDAEVGRVVLFDFGEARGPRIRTLADQRFYGLVNLNFYTDDIRRYTAEFAALGFRPWTEPIQHVMGASVGAPTEVMIDGPDGVIVNLIELTTGDAGTRIGHMRAYVEREFGYNDAGFTPVVTTQHCVSRLEPAVRFYERVTGMGVLIDDMLVRDELNRFMRYPPGSRTRAVFMQGGHMFGKVALNFPLDQSFEDSVARTTPTSVGYFAQSFLVDDLDAALDGARDVGAATFSEPVSLDVPGIGATRAAVVRNPGSGALQELVERPT